MINIIKDKNFTLEELLRLLAERYPIGLYEYLSKYEPEMFRKMRDLEDDFDNAFLYKATDDLKKILREYWTLHMDAIRKFKNQDKLDSSVNEVKEQNQKNA